MIFVALWFGAGQLWAAASDAATLRIPNALILYLLAGYGATVALTGPGWTDLAASAAVGIAILAFGTILFARGWMGGGDVKLLAVTGLWLGPAATPALLLLTAIAGGLLTLGLITGRAVAAHCRGGDRVAALHASMERVPYGIAIAAAALAVVVLRPGALLSG